MNCIFRIIIILCLVSFHQGLAQNETFPCGTVPTEDDIHYYNLFRQQRQLFYMQRDGVGNGSSPLRVFVQNFLVRRDNGTTGLIQLSTAGVIASLNSAFTGSGIEFESCGYEEIDNSDFNEFDQNDDETALTTQYDVEDVVNVYYVGSVTTSNTVCGYTYRPSSTIGNFGLMIDYTCDIENTVIHEMGHYFSLYHTHGKSNCGFTDERVDGSNCQTAGDDICDTPADPNLQWGLDDNLVPDCSGSHVNVGLFGACTYTGDFTDANNDLFEPDITNYMSYAPKTCRTIFTAQQLSCMRFSLLNDRPYLICNVCPEILTISGPQIFDNVYEARRITCTSFIIDNVDIQLNAGDRVYLGTGFKAFPGSKFKAKIECNN